MSWISQVVKFRIILLQRSAMNCPTSLIQTSDSGAQRAGELSVPMEIRLLVKHATKHLHLHDLSTELDSTPRNAQVL